MVGRPVVGRRLVERELELMTMTTRMTTVTTTPVTGDAGTGRQQQAQAPGSTWV
jgi:hypothetical protein